MLFKIFIFIILFFFSFFIAKRLSELQPQEIKDFKRIINRIYLFSSLFIISLFVWKIGVYLWINILILILISLLFYYLNSIKRIMFFEIIICLIIILSLFFFLDYVIISLGMINIFCLGLIFKK